MPSDIAVPLYRNGNMVSSLCNSFSGSLRETRLTAITGYLISLSPQPFLKLFGITENPTEINLEYSEEVGRSDIQIVTSSGIIIVEAKTELVDPIKQARRYKAKWRILLTNYNPLKNSNSDKIKYINWQHIYDICVDISKSKDYRLKFLALDLIKYLKEYHMVKKDERIEIYAREINEEKTLSLFLHGRLYGCDFEDKNKIAEARYFAPHFGQKISNLHPGITTGISYIAKISTIDITDSKKGLLDIIKKHRGTSWLKKNMYLIEPILNWPWTNIRRNFLFLEEPRLVFNPPVKKDLLQKGKGWLSKRYLTFDELFQAWSGEAIS